METNVRTWLVSGDDMYGFVRTLFQMHLITDENDFILFNQTDE